MSNSNSNVNYHKSPLYFCLLNQYQNSKPSLFNYDPLELTEAPRELNFPGFSNLSSNNVQFYGRSPMNSGHIISRNTVNNSIITPERICFASIFLILYLACNSMTILVAMPYFIILFMSNKVRSYLFIFLSLLMIASGGLLFMLVPLFGLLYSSKRIHISLIAVSISIFWGITIATNGIYIMIPMFKSG